MSRLGDFVVEVHRRRVFRVAGLYIVAAWVALQVADLALSSFGFPETALRYVWFAAFAGFPVAVIFGWRFDIVDGRVLRAEPATIPAELKLRRADVLVLCALAAVAAATIYGIGRNLSVVGSPAPDVAGPAELDPKSIAVLPFANLSRDRDDAELLALGIQDDLLTRLSGVGDLKVISRTSVERYRDSSFSLPEIGRQLGVGKILEGSVLQAGGQIRVNVQLIDASDDTHIWATTYDQNMTASNLFDIQASITDSITRELRATLTPKETNRLESMPTTSLDAYTEYLTGRQRADVESIEALSDAIEHFKSAIDRDPQFALAHVALADAYLTLATNFHGGLTSQQAVAMAEPPLALALELDPDIGQAYATLGLLRQLQGDPVAAEEAFATAIALRPSYSRAFRLYARLEWQLNRREHALELIGRALELDPFSAPVNFDMARYYDVTGQFDDAMERYLQVVEIEPDHAFAYVYIAAIHYLVYGRADEALIWYHKAAARDALSPSLHAAPAIPYLEIGDADSARAWVQRGLELGADTFWSRWTSLLLNLYTGDDEASLKDARQLLDIAPRFWGALFLLRNADLAAGRYEVAHSRYARAFRELVEPELPDVNPSNYAVAVDMALVLMRLGDRQLANELLEGCLETIEDLPRYGTDGYWISDVRVYALQQRRDRALAALREAVDGGWRTLAWLFLDHDPALDSIRDEPEFERLRQKVALDMETQAARVRELRDSGELPAM